MKLISITRSFSYKKSLGNYQMADFFCSQTAECKESDAEKTSEALYQFTKKEVVKSLNEFEKNGLLEPQPPQTPVSQEDPEGWKRFKKIRDEKGEDKDFGKKEEMADIAMGGKKEKY